MQVKSQGVIIERGTVSQDVASQPPEKPTDAVQVCSGIIQPHS